MSNQYLDKLLLITMFSIMFLSCLCWGKILLDGNGDEPILVESAVSEEVRTVKQIRNNATMLSGALVVLSRFVHIASGEED
ncbi:hypothetical protein JMN32_24605 [Fulvivirga sp. 29W222]|uniref:Uncharacterized protein n=1 Tax=Fulvivirga marina TaxID=2494733 RepID=A0A937G6V5_9BACT|nr:hypothetical protein [Fulvivirga marina]MBL6449516.1 hypothetical protein [Fulvivirga marina]